MTQIFRASKKNNCSNNIGVIYLTKKYGYCQWQRFTDVLFFFFFMTNSLKYNTTLFSEFTFLKNTMVFYQLVRFKRVIYLFILIYYHKYTSSWIIIIPGCHDWWQILVLITYISLISFCILFSMYDMMYGFVFTRFSTNSKII